MDNMDNMNNNDIEKYIENDIENEIDNIIENTTYNLHQSSVDKQLNKSNSRTQILNEELDLDLVNITHNDTESYLESGMNSSIINIPGESSVDTPSVDVPSVDTPSVDAPSVDVFNEALHQYLRIDVEIKTLSLALKTRTDIKKKLSETLTSFLNTKQIKTVNLDGSYKENIIS